MTVLPYSKIALTLFAIPLASAAIVLITMGLHSGFPPGRLGSAVQTFTLFAGPVAPLCAFLGWLDVRISGSRVPRPHVLAVMLAVGVSLMPLGIVAYVLLVGVHQLVAAATDKASWSPPPWR
jgi:hypothetical protein